MKWHMTYLISNCLVASARENSWNNLTHIPLNKMAVILADDIFKCNFLNENDTILIYISLKFVPRSPNDKAELV